MFKLPVKLKNIIKVINKDTFDTFIVTFALFLIGFISYLLQFILGRLLSVESFGDFNGLLSFVTILSLLAGVIGMALVKIFSELYSDKSYGLLRNTFKKLMIISIVAGISISLAIIIFSENISKALNIVSSEVIIYFSLSFFLSFVTLFFGTLLQGINKFIYFSIYLIQGSLSRLIVTVLLVYFVSRSSSMVFLGFFISHVISLFVGIYLYKKSKIKSYKGNQEYIKGSSTKQFKKIIIDGIPIAIITGVMTMITNNDLMLVKNLFSPYNAGIYAGVVTLGKVILFGSGSVATVMYPRVISVRKSGRDVLKLVHQFMTIQVLLISLPLAFYSLFPRFIAGLLFGAKYYPTVPYLPIYAIFVSCWVLINFILTLFIALDYRKVAIILPLFIVIQYLGISVYHDTIFDILKVNLFTITLFTIFVLFVFVFKMKSISRNYDAL